MAGPACKVIINELTSAVTSALETVLTSTWVREKITPERADALIQELADLDISHYLGQAALITPVRGLAHIVEELVALGVFTDEVWEILRRPPGGTAA